MILMSLQFTPQMTDFVNAAGSVQRKRNENLAWIGLALCLPFSLLYACLIFLDTGSTFTSVLPFFAFMVLGLPLFFVFRVFRNPVTVDENLLKPTEWTFTDNSLRISSPIMNVNLEWATFSNVMESPDHYFLVHSSNKNIFHILPKRAFENSESENAFREFVQSRYGEISTTTVQSGSKVALFLLGALYLCNVLLFFYSNLQAAF